MHHCVLNDCAEFVFHFTKEGNVKLDKLAIGVPYQDKTNIGRYANRDLWTAVTLGLYLMKRFGIESKDLILQHFQLN